MAKFAGQFTDAPIMIYDIHNNFIAKTIISRHNWGQMYIEVTEGLENTKPGTRLHLLIIHSGGVSEFDGTYKCVRQGIFEITIYGERKRDARGSKRLPLNISAQIKEITVNSEIVQLREPVQVTVENISKTGVLVNSPELRLIINVISQIELNIQGRDTILYAKVVREQTNGDGTYSFGCRLVFSK